MRNWVMPQKSLGDPMVHKSSLGAGYFSKQKGPWSKGWICTWGKLEEDKSEFWNSRLLQRLALNN